MDCRLGAEATIKYLEDKIAAKRANMARKAPEVAVNSMASVALNAASAPASFSKARCRWYNAITQLLDLVGVHTDNDPSIPRAVINLRGANSDSFFVTHQDSPIFM
jgi:hypothetical protein